MTLPTELGWMDAAFLATLSAFLLAWIQYWKKSLPETEWIIRVFGMFSSLFFCFLLNDVARTPDKTLSPLAVILYGVAAAVFSDFGYQFLSSSKSGAFTLPSQAQLKGGETAMAEKEKKIVAKKEEILKQFQELEKMEKSAQLLGKVEPKLKL